MLYHNGFINKTLKIKYNPSEIIIPNKDKLLTSWGIYDSLTGYLDENFMVHGA